MEWFWMGCFCKNIQLTFPTTYINNLPDDVICNIAIYADDTTLSTKCDQASASIPHSDCSALFGLE